MRNAGSLFGCPQTIENADFFERCKIQEKENVKKSKKTVDKSGGRC